MDGENSAAFLSTYDGETSDEELEVESILAREIWDGWPYYFLKWKNYGSEDNSWQPIENMVNSMALVVDFEEGIKEDVKAGPSWHPKGETWEHKQPVLGARGFKALDFLRQCSEAEKEALTEAEMAQPGPADEPLHVTENGVCASQHASELLAPATLSNCGNNRTAVDPKPLGVISTPKFDIHNDITQFLESPSSGHGYVVVSEIPKSVEFVASGIDSADEAPQALDFASSACPWARTASNSDCQSDSVPRKEPQAASYNAGCASMVDCRQVFQAKAGESGSGENIQGLVAQKKLVARKQSKSSKRTRRWRRNIRKRKAEENKLKAQTH